MDYGEERPDPSLGKADAEDHGRAWPPARLCALHEYYNSYKGELSPASSNFVYRNFHAAWPDRLWLTDISQFPMDGYRVYLSAIIDCGAGWWFAGRFHSTRMRGLRAAPCWTRSKRSSLGSIAQSARIVAWTTGGICGSPSAFGPCLPGEPRLTMRQWKDSSADSKTSSSTTRIGVEYFSMTSKTGWESGSLIATRNGKNRIWVGKVPSNIV